MDNPAKVPVHPPIKIAFSAPKKKMRKAVDRNRVKRLMREAFRLQQHNYAPPASQPPSTLGVMVLFIGNEMPEYEAIFKAMKRFMDQL